MVFWKLKKLILLKDVDLFALGDCCSSVFKFWKYCCFDMWASLLIFKLEGKVYKLFVCWM